MSWWSRSGFTEYQPPSLACFGITEGLALGITGLTGGLVSGGLATAGAGALEGAAGGALLSGVTGGDPLKGALGGAVTGGAVAGLGPLVSSATGLGATASDALVGAGAGAAGSLITGTDPLKGALTGGAGGLAAGALSGTAGGGTSAASVAGGASTPTSPTATGVNAGGVSSGAGAGPVGASSGGSDFFNALPGSGGQDFAGGGTPVTGGGGIDKLLGFAQKNPALLLAAAPAALSLFGSPSPLPGQAQLTNLAAEQQSQGRTLAGYATSGTLPPGMEAHLDLQTQAKKAAIRSSFASAGYSNSSAEVQALAQVDQEALANRAALAQQLAGQGLDYTRLGTESQEKLLTLEQGQQTEFSNAIANFSKGLVPLASAFDKQAA